MIKSMTGYGGAKAAGESYEFSVELKSVNNRYLDVSIRMPKSFMFAEESVKLAVSSHVSRGKTDVFININSLFGEDASVTVNEALAAEYKAAIDKIADILSISPAVSAYEIAKLPDVLSLDKKELDRDEALKQLMPVVEAALSDFDSMRCKEGEKLCEDVLSRLDTLENCVSLIEKCSPKSVSEYREKLSRRMQDVLENTQIDEGRILTEAAIYADRTAVDEETVRLRSHISQMRSMLTGESPAGRKLDFIVQELNRETNTIGSKCSDQEITRLVLDMKSEIEKIREQVQNIE
jgi:uncharacterized protein (TIGR00255 family)